MTKDTQSGLHNLLHGDYDAATIEKALAALPPDLQRVVAEGLKMASQERKKERDTLQLQTSIAEFAVAFHLILANMGNPKYAVDIINWDDLTGTTARAVTAYYTPELEDKMPDSVRKAVAYYFTSTEFMHGATRDEIDAVLEPFEYPTSRILDDLTTAYIERGSMGSKNPPEHIRARYENVFRNINFDNDYPELEQQMRDDLLTLDYQLPELEEDKSYGHAKERGDSYPRFTADMLPG